MGMKKKLRKLYNSKWSILLFPLYILIIPVFLIILYFVTLASEFILMLGPIGIIAGLIGFVFQGILLLFHVNKEKSNKLSFIIAVIIFVILSVVYIYSIQIDAGIINYLEFRHNRSNMELNGP